MPGILAIIFIFGGGTLALLGFTLGPIGRAVGDKIRRGASGSGLSDEARAELAAFREALSEELEATRHELAELAERLDFAERLLAKTREPQRLVPP